MPNLLVFQNEYAHLVNSLPYIDEKISDTDKNKVNDLIKQEMIKMTQKDYLEKLPLPPCSVIVSHYQIIIGYQNSDLIKNEMERIEKGEKLDI